MTQDFVSDASDPTDPTNPKKLGLSFSAMIWRGREILLLRSSDDGHGDLHRDGRPMSVLHELTENERREPDKGFVNGSQS